MEKRFTSIQRELNRLATRLDRNSTSPLQITSIILCPHHHTAHHINHEIEICGCVINKSTTFTAKHRPIAIHIATSCTDYISQYAIGASHMYHMAHHLRKCTCGMHAPVSLQNQSNTNLPHSLISLHKIIMYTIKNSPHCDSHPLATSGTASRLRTAGPPECRTLWKHRRGSCAPRTAHNGARRHVQPPTFRHVLRCAGRKKRVSH